MTDKIAILVPVWHSYRWLAPVCARALDRFWPDHPKAFFVGADRASFSEGETFSADGADPTNWSAVLYEGIVALRDAGYETVYLIAEEHLPLAPCSSLHLGETLPRLLDELPANYISLMGWDNRRFTSKSPVLGRDLFHLKHLCRDGDPRYHLHPALWRVEALEACCRNALRDPAARGSAWHFEKVNDRDEGFFPVEWKRRCYQIHAASMRSRRPSAARSAREGIEIFLFRRLQGLYPLLPIGLRAKYAKTLRFDDVFCDGPYPMYFSGVMAKGGANPLFVNFLKKRDPEMLESILAAMPAARRENF